MRKHRSFVVRSVFTGFVIIVCSFAVSAQSTLFNIPSTDVVAEKSLFFEGDFISHFGDFRKGGFRSYGIRTVYGLKRRFEVGANVFVTKSAGGRAREFQPNFKWKTYEKEKYGFAVSTGAMFFVPLNRPAGNRTFGMFYSNASKIVKRTGGTRVTGGIYTVAGAGRYFGTKTGTILGVEQPVIKKLSFIADWYSGKNRFGYSAAGFSYPITSRQFLMAGYNFGNTGRGNNSFAAFYGYTF
jgi:hypothetical protein